MTLEEAARAAALLGYHAIVVNPGPGICDQATLHNLRAHARECAIYMEIEIFVAAKLTHTPPGLITQAIGAARKNGAQLVLGFGETIAPDQPQPMPGTNLSAIEGGVDILLHPGLITPEEARLAARRNTALEISLSPAHALANGHIRMTAAKTGAAMIFGSDARETGDFLSADHIRRIALGAAMTEEDFRNVMRVSVRLLNRLFSRPPENYT